MIIFGKYDSKRGFLRARLFFSLGAILILCASPASFAATGVIGWGALNGTDDGQITVPPGLNNAVACAAGFRHSLALRDDGTVIGWGRNSHGQTTPPPGLTNVTAISAGWEHSLALKSDGTVVAWGDNTVSQTNVPPDLTGATAIAADYYANVVLKNSGSLVAWGYSIGGLTNVPPDLTNITAIAAGSDLGIALKSDGSVMGWGANNYVSRKIPTGLSNVVAVAARGIHGLVLKNDGTVFDWTLNNPYENAAPAGVSNIVAIAAGNAFSLALRSDGTVLAWGNNSYGQTNLPANLAHVVGLAAGSVHCLAITNDGSPVIVRQPLDQMKYSGAPAMFSAGAVGNLPLSYQWHRDGTNITGATNALLALSDIQPTDAALYWVEVSNSQGTVISSNAGLTVLLASPTMSLQPQSQVIVSGLQPTNAIFTAGAFGSEPLTYQWQFNGIELPGATNTGLTITNAHLTEAGAYFVLASNAYGVTTSAVATLTVIPAPPRIVTQPTNQMQVRGGSTTTRLAAVGYQPLSYQWQLNGNPVPGATSSVFTILNVQQNDGGNYSVVVNSPYGSTVSSNAQILIVPTLVAAWGSGFAGSTNVPFGLTNILGIAAGWHHGLALRWNGTIIGWGLNASGEIDIPAGLTNVIQVAAGLSHSIALRRDGTVVTWGNNFYHQTNMPPGLTNVIAVSGGFSHSLALKNDGTVVSWGDNYYGQGDVPTGLDGVVAISAGGSHSMALRTNGMVVAWGAPAWGQTSIPADLSDVVAISAGNGTSLALTSDGRVFGWGNDLWGASTGIRNTNSSNSGSGPVIVGGQALSNVVAIASGNSHGLALRQDGTMATWGMEGSVAVTVPSGLPLVGSISVGGSLTVVLLQDGGPVLTAPVSAPALTTNGFNLSAATMSGRTYRLEYINSLAEDTWIPFPVFAGNAGVQGLTDSAAPGPQRFYRVRQW